MAACDQISKYIQRVTPLAGGVFPISFPTTLVAITESTNASVTVVAGAATQVLAANANRKFAQIVNVTGSTLRISVGAAAQVTDLEFPTGSVYKLEPDTIGEISQQLVSIWNPTGGNLTVTVQEF